MKTPEKKSRRKSAAKKRKSLSLNRLLDPTGYESADRLSQEALNRFEAIPLLSRDESSIAERTGQISYDTWAGDTAATLRDAAPGYIRRVTLKAGQLILELVAERRKTDWEFVARVYEGNEIRHDFVLRAGRNRVLPRSGGFYRWSSVAVPRLVRLNSYDSNISFQELSW